MLVLSLVFLSGGFKLMKISGKAMDTQLPSFTPLRIILLKAERAC